MPRKPASLKDAIDHKKAAPVTRKAKKADKAIEAETPMVDTAERMRQATRKPTGRTLDEVIALLHRHGIRFNEEV